MRRNVRSQAGPSSPFPQDPNKLGYVWEEEEEEGEGEEETQITKVSFIHMTNTS